MSIEVAKIEVELDSKNGCMVRSKCRKLVRFSLRSVRDGGKHDHERSLVGAVDYNLDHIQSDHDCPTEVDVSKILREVVKTRP